MVWKQDSGFCCLGIILVIKTENLISSQTINLLRVVMAVVRLLCCAALMPSLVADLTVASPFCFTKLRRLGRYFPRVSFQAMRRTSSSWTRCGGLRDNTVSPRDSWYHLTISSQVIDSTPTLLTVLLLFSQYHNWLLYSTKLWEVSFNQLQLALQMS